MASSAGHRIHAIILTRDRPATLARSTSSVLAALGGGDLLTVLDSSGVECHAANVRVVHEARRGATAPCRLLGWNRVRPELVRAWGPATTEWARATHGRDIAPIRNLSLLLAIAVPSEIVVLLDDDVVGADLPRLHKEVVELCRAGRGDAVAAEIRGVSELDVVSRLEHAIDVLSFHGGVRASDDPKQVFGGADGIHGARASGARCYPSGGCLALAVTPARIAGFPPGYNEDWLWSLLRTEGADSRAGRSSHPVVHDPPTVRCPGPEDCLFELTGDLVLDCLESLGCEEAADERLRRLASARPDPGALPKRRVQELLQRLKSAGLERTGRRMLEEHGLTALEHLLDCGALDKDWGAVVSDWSRDAASKLRSFEAATRDDRALAHLRQIWQEGARE